MYSHDSVSNWSLTRNVYIEAQTILLYSFTPNQDKNAFFELPDDVFTALNELFEAVIANHNLHEVLFASKASTPDNVNINILMWPRPRQYPTPAAVETLPFLF